MGVTLFSPFLGQKKELYRVYKKIDKLEFQYYFNNVDEARKRQEKLDELQKESLTWKKRNVFIQSDGVGSNMLNGSNIGIRHVFLRLEKINNQPGSNVFPAVVVNIGNRTLGGPLSKSFPVSTVGWPQALYQAVNFAYEKTVPDDDGQVYNQAMTWVERNQEEVFDGFWKLIAHADTTMIINSEICRSGQMMYIKLTKKPMARPVLYASLPKFSRSVTVTSYNHLFHMAAYFVALQIIHREFEFESNYAAYAAGIYFMLKGEWLTVMQRHGIDCDHEIEEHRLTVDKWWLLINQWAVAEYGDVLL